MRCARNTFVKLVLAAICLTTAIVTPELSQARPHYAGKAEDASGAIVSGATVTVYEAGTSTKATLYNAAGAVSGNPMNTDSLGLYDFYVDAGAYDIVHSKSGVAFYNFRSAGLEIGGGGGGSGDVTDVWGCTSGNCNALTAAAWQPLFVHRRRPT